MGGTTPNWAIRYPYQSETVALTHFSNLATDVNTALSTIETRRQATLNRPTARIRNAIPPTQNVSAGVTATVTFSVATWDNDGMWNGGANDRLTIQTAGVYEFIAEIDLTQTVATTLNAQEIQIFVTTASTTATFAQKYNRETQTGSAHMNTAGMWPMDVGDTAQVKFWFSGTGTMQPGGAFLAARYVCSL